jgi:surface polysaccharide O-acyltransferase-like enzyme
LTADQFLWSSLSKEPYFQYLLRFVKIITYAGYGIVAASFYGVLKRGFDKTTGKQIAMVAIFVGSLLFVIKLIQSYKVILAGKWIYDFAPGYWADFLMPAVLVLVIMSLKHLNWPTVFSKIAPYSFGLYLLHPAVLDIIEIGLSTLNLHPAPLVIVKYTLALIGTASVVFIISRISMISWAIGIGDLPFGGKPKGPNGMPQGRVATNVG